MASADNSNQPSTNSDSVPSFDTPEGRLGHYYEHAVTQTLEKFLASIRYSIFKSKYPELYKECGKEFRDLHKQLINQLRDTITTDLKNLSTETNVFSSLKALDDMITKQSDRADEDSWRPSGNPENDIRDHVHHQKLKHKKCLEFVLETYVVENNKLEQIVEQNHAEIMKLKKEIDNDNQEVQSYFAAVNALDLLKLDEDIHSMFGKK
ncbi:polyamine-modulated factor 1-like [Argiope bruennichi]|uniref:polyamine-modulated factor 1-like n=1 Tax=Argiope bruennichi TaxID=94029 RepID=UPI0024941143|nr:polyamine-modulated factor 1-like [Argiope bruennichi]